MSSRWCPSTKAGALNFLNSLRELGNTVSLLHSDIPDYLTGLRRREQLQADPRWPRTPLEPLARSSIDSLTAACRHRSASGAERSR